MRLDKTALGLLWTMKHDTKDGANIGRYPLVSWGNRYLKTMTGTFAESTLTNLKRRFRNMQRNLQCLKAIGGISTVNPQNLTEQDVGEIVVFYRNAGLSPKTVDHEFSALGNLMLYTGNSAFATFRLRNPGMFPKIARPRYAPMERTVFNKILERSESVKAGDWKRMRAFAIVLFALGTGTRMKELRNAKASDLDLRDGVFHAEHVKGEGRYGQARDIPIRPEIMPFLAVYIEVRRQALMKRYLVSDVLFPNMQRNQGDGLMSENCIRKEKSLVEKETKTKFDLRACRRTYGQLALDDGISVESVSVSMGHSSTKTTETYYARRRNQAAIGEAQKQWRSANGSPAKNPSNGLNDWLSGYA